MEHRTKDSHWLALIGLSLASFLGLLDLTVVNTALPAIQAEFHASVSQLQWVMNTLLLALTASMVILGKLADMHGRRLFLYIGLVLFAVSSVGAGLATSIYVLILSRFLQGLAIALLYTAPLALIPSLFPLDQQGKATGILVGVSNFGLAFGPALGGIILSTLGWRWIFFINPPIVLVCFLCCWKTLDESKNSAPVEKMDWSGFLLLLVSVPLFIFALIESRTLGYLNPALIGMLSLALLGMFLLYRVESQVKTPIIQFSLLSQPTFLLGLIANFALASFYAIDFFLIPLYLHYIRGQSGNEIGFTLLPATLLVAFLSPLVGRYVDKNGPEKALLLGLALLSISAMIQIRFIASTPIYYVVAAYLLFGIGWACILSSSITAALTSVPRSSGGIAAGTLGTFHNFGGAIGLALGTLLFSSSASQSLANLVNAASLPVGPWIADAAANIERATQIITANTPLNDSAAQQLFQQFFLHGYAEAMWLPVILPMLALIYVFRAYLLKL